MAGVTMRDVRTAFAVALLCFSAPAVAETLPITGGDPALANANDLLRIAVERFEGEDGGVLAQAVEAELGAVQVDGEHYFQIVAPESRAPIDGLITGSVRADVEESKVIEKRKRCVEHDSVDKKKCRKEVEVDIRCRRRITTQATTVRLVAIKDGAIRYSRSLNARDDITYCPDRTASQTVEDFLAGARRDHVRAIRRDLAPTMYTKDIRVDENRKGLSKPAQDAFKAAVHQTKTDPAAACASWTALTRDAVPTAALAFNLGLCAEMEGKFDTAIDWYGEVQRQEPRNDDASEGLARIDRTVRSYADWNERNRRPSQ